MKKISLKNLNVQESGILSREQLKNVLGGYSGENPDPTTTCLVSEDPNCTTTEEPGDCTILQGSYSGRKGWCEYAPWNPEMQIRICVIRENGQIVTYSHSCGH